MTEITVNLHQTIYNQLASEAEGKGLTIEEHIRAILGEHISLYSHIGFSKPGLMTFPSVPTMQPTMDKITRMANMIINQMSSQGMLKCPTCTMPISSDDLEKGECSSCGYKL